MRFAECTPPTWDTQSARADLAAAQAAKAQLWNVARIVPHQQRDDFMLK